jgi:hypothetical protein
MVVDFDRLHQFRRTVFTVGTSPCLRARLRSPRKVADPLFVRFIRLFLIEVGVVSIEIEQ